MLCMLVMLIKCRVRVCNSEYQLVYLSTEALLTNTTWRDMLGSSVYQQNLVAFVVDEVLSVGK